MAGSTLKTSLIETDNTSTVHHYGVLFVQTLLRILHNFENYFKKQSNNVAIALGPMSASLVLAFVKIKSSDEDGIDGQRTVAMLAILAWICIWWVTEALPIAITSLLPLLLFPVLGIQEADTVSKAYMNDTITLFIGSFILARAVEKHNVHRRLALKLLLVFGGQRMEPRLLLLGFCIGPAFVSMWISNTATAIMMMPMSIGVLQKLQASSTQPIRTLSNTKAGSSQSPYQKKLHFDDDHLHEIDGGFIQETDLSKDINLEVDDLSDRNKEDFEISSAPEEIKPEENAEFLKNYGRGVVLAIAYAVCIGGLTTLTGTGTNLILSGMWSSRYPNAPPISYLKWFLFAFPLGVVHLLFLWMLLCILYCPSSALSTISRSFNKSTIQEEFDSLAYMDYKVTKNFATFWS